MFGAGRNRDGAGFPCVNRVYNWRHIESQTCRVPCYVAKCDLKREIAIFRCTLGAERRGLAIEAIQPVLKKDANA